MICHDGVNMFLCKTAESVQTCDKAHLDAWEADIVEYAVNELKAFRFNTTIELTEWPVCDEGYASNADLWIQDSQMMMIIIMKDLLRVPLQWRRRIVPKNSWRKGSDY
jgi:hypothetical protein